MFKPRRAAGIDGPPQRGSPSILKKMQITILYDNDAWEPRLAADWGFACRIQTGDKTILFDTGANGRILLSNMQKLGIDPREIDEVFISHDHWDHAGGLADFLKQNPVRVYVPSRFSGSYPGIDLVFLDAPAQIHDNLYSTGTLSNIEQSLVIQQKNSLVVVAGCSHPGVGEILKAASAFGRVTALIGGLHGFREFHLLKDLHLVCATHCTQYKDEILARSPAISIEGGAGRVITIE